MKTVRKVLATVTVFALVVVCVPMFSLVTAAKAYYTLTGTTLDEIQQQLEDFFSYVMFVNPPAEDTEFTVVVRKEEQPVTFDLLVDAMGDWQHFDRYAYVRYCDFLWRNPYNPTFLPAGQPFSLDIYSSSSGTVFNDMMRFTLSYRVNTPSEPSPTQTAALAFLRNENPEFPYPVNGTNLEKFQAINRYICLRCYYYSPYDPPTGPVTDQIGVDCFGYSGLGLFIMRSAGFPTITVRNLEAQMGLGNNNHMWLNTFVDGYWYGVDFNLNDGGWSDPSSTVYSEAMLLSSDVNFFQYTTDHPVCDQDYRMPKTKPPIVQPNTHSGQLLPILPPGMENLTVAVVYPPMPAAQVISAGDTSLRVTWTAVAGAEGYSLGYSEDPPGTSRSIRVRSLDAGETSAVIENLVSGKTYYITVVCSTRSGVGNDDYAPILVGIPGTVSPAPMPSYRPIATSMTLSESLTLRVGEEMRMVNYSYTTEKFSSPILQLEPEDASFYNVVWTISDESVATIRSVGSTYDPPLGIAYRCSSDFRLVGLKPGTVTLTATTDYSGIVATCTVTVPPLTIPPPLKGDVDSSGGVDSSDARMVLQHEVGLIGLNAAQRSVANVNDDEKVDSSDARMILQYEVGLIVL